MKRSLMVIADAVETTAGIYREGEQSAACKHDNMAGRSSAGLEAARTAYTRAWACGGMCEDFSSAEHH